MRRGHARAAAARSEGDGFRAPTTVAPYFVDWVIDQVPGYAGSANRDLTVVTTNKVPQGSYRGWGVPAHNLALEEVVVVSGLARGIDASAHWMAARSA